MVDDSKKRVYIRKPFGQEAKGLSSGNWLPVIDEFRNYFHTSHSEDSMRIREF